MGFFRPFLRMKKSLSSNDASHFGKVDRWRSKAQLLRRQREVVRVTFGEGEGFGKVGPVI